MRDLSTSIFVWHGQKAHQKWVDLTKKWTTRFWGGRGVSTIEQTVFSEGAHLVLLLQPSLLLFHQSSLVSHPPVGLYKHLRPLLQPKQLRLNQRVQPRPGGAMPRKLWGRGSLLEPDGTAIVSRAVGGRHRSELLPGNVGGGFLRPPSRAHALPRTIIQEEASSLAERTTREVRRRTAAARLVLHAGSWGATLRGTGARGGAHWGARALRKCLTVEICHFMSLGGDFLAFDRTGQNLKNSPA